MSARPFVPPGAVAASLVAAALAACAATSPAEAPAGHGGMNRGTTKDMHCDMAARHGEGAASGAGASHDMACMAHGAASAPAAASGAVDPHAGHAGH